MMAHLVFLILAAVFTSARADVTAMRGSGNDSNLLARICPSSLVRSGKALENSGTACVGLREESILDLSLVVFNFSEKPETVNVVFQGYDQIENRVVGEKISAPFTFANGANAYSLTDIFGGEARIKQLIPFAASANPYLVSIALERQNGTDTGITFCTSVAGGGSTLNLSISSIAIMPAFSLNSESVDYVTMSGAVAVNLGYQYVFKRYFSLGASGVLLVKDKVDTGQETSIVAWPGLSLSASKLSSSGIRYSIDLLGVYDFEKNGPDRFLMGAALNFGLDIAMLFKGHP